MRILLVLEVFFIVNSMNLLWSFLGLVDFFFSFRRVMLHFQCRIPWL